MRLQMPPGARACALLPAALALSPLCRPVVVSLHSGRGSLCTSVFPLRYPCILLFIILSSFSFSTTLLVIAHSLYTTLPNMLGRPIGDEPLKKIPIRRPRKA